MHTYVHTYVRTYIHTYVRTYIHTYKKILVYFLVSVLVYARMYIYVYDVYIIYIYIYPSTFTHMSHTCLFVHKRIPESSNYPQIKHKLRQIQD